MRRASKAAAPLQFSYGEQQRMSYPENYKYAKSHEWLLLEGDKATVGITDYAQSSLGDIVFIELPKVGQEIEAGSTFG
jgi:glycine cleavage system H protein